MLSMIHANTVWCALIRTVPWLTRLAKTTAQFCLRLPQVRYELLGLPFVDLLSFYILLFEKEGLK